MALQNVSGRLYEHEEVLYGRGRCPEISLARGLPHAVYFANRVPSTPLGGKPPYSMWHGGKLPRLEHL